MDAPLRDDDDNNNMYDVLKGYDSAKTDRNLLKESLQQEVDRALNTLTVREQELLKLYYGLGDTIPHTLEEIGIKFDLTRERVRQIKEKAIKRLKHTSRNKILKTYLG